MVIRLLVALALIATPAFGSAVNVLTQHNDNLRTGANLNETILTPANVNQYQFGKLFDQAVDGYVYAQPLYMSAVNITAGNDTGVHNMVLIATEHDSVYAFDADSAAGLNAQPIWHTSFINPGAGVTTVPNAEVNSTDIVPEIGITSTPVIDSTTGTLYVVSKTKNFNPANPGDSSAWSYHQFLHALDIRTGLEKPSSPVEITASFFGTGDGNDGNGNVPFNPLTQHNRSALLLLNNTVYVGWASHGDNPPYHGIFIGFNAKTLQQVATFNTTPDGNDGGIWMSGQGAAADSRGNIFLATGNGSFDTDQNGVHTGNNYGDSVMRFTTTTTGDISLADYFTPYDQAYLADNDVDLASGGVMLLPDRPGPYPHLAIACGKEGTLYVINRDSMSGFHVTGDFVHQVLPFSIPSGVWGSPAYFDGRIYYHGVSDNLFEYILNPDGTLIPEPLQGNPGGSYGYPGATPSISASGTSNGIVWDIDSSGFGYGPAFLHAYDASDIYHLLYYSYQNPSRDNPGNGTGQSGWAVKFTTPTIANGHVYVGAQYDLAVYGLLTGTMPLTVSVSGSGSVNSSFAGTTPRTLNTAYSITATAAAGYIFAGWQNTVTSTIISYSPTLTFTMAENFALQAIFIPNPFTAVAGHYSGIALVQTPDVQTGGATSITVGNNGAFSASIRLGASTYRLAGVLRPDGSYEASIPRGALIPLSLSLQLDINNGSNQITGSISDGSSTGAITATRPSPAYFRQAGAYTLIINPPSDTSLPQGAGLGTLTADAHGNIRFAGLIGDGTPVTQAAVANGYSQWAFYAPSGVAGSITGLMTFETTSSSDIDGTLRWQKRSTALTPAIATTVTAIGATYQNYFKPILGLSGTATFTASSPALPGTPATKSFTLASTNKITLAPGTTGLTMNFTTPTGMITGTFTDASNKSHPYTAITFQRNNTAPGQFKPNATTTGPILISN